MKRIGAAFFLAAAWLSAGAATDLKTDLKVDHVTIAGRDLKAMWAKLAAAGIAVEYGGKHTNGLTQMALASFADGSYLELIAAQDPKAGAANHYWGKFIDGDAGPCAWAIAVKNLDQEAKRLGSTITKGGRKRPDGAELKWRSAAVGPEAQGTFFPFMIQDETARALRAYPHGEATMPAISGVAAVYIGVRNLDEAVKRYRTAFHLGEAVKGADKELGVTTASFAGTPVVLATAGTGWLAERLAKFGEAPCAFVLRGVKNVQWLDIRGMKIGIGM